MTRTQVTRQVNVHETVSEVPPMNIPFPPSLPSQQTTGPKTPIPSLRPALIPSSTVVVHKLKDIPEETTVQMDVDELNAAISKSLLRRRGEVLIKPTIAVKPYWTIDSEEEKTTSKPSPSSLQSLEEPDENMSHTTQTYSQEQRQQAASIRLSRRPDQTVSLSSLLGTRDRHASLSSTFGQSTQEASVDIEKPSSQNKDSQFQDVISKGSDDDEREK